MSVKNKKTKIYIGSGIPTAANLAGAVTIASVGFGCNVTSMNGLGFSRGTTDDDSVYCDGASFKKKDTSELEISNFTTTLLVDPSNDDYQAVEALAKEMIVADTEGTFVLVEPNGTDKIWMQTKILKWEVERGGAEDKKKLSIELLARTLPSDK